MYISSVSQVLKGASTFSSAEATKSTHGEEEHDDVMMCLLVGNNVRVV